MGKKDSRVDAYIAGAADFARPILKQVRTVVHQGCPGVEEQLKWNVPAFVYKGMLCIIPAFKAHCRLIFWKHRLLDAQGKRGLLHLRSISDLPGRKLLLKLVQEAKSLNDLGVRPPKRKARPLDIPDYFMKALKANRKAFAAFEKGSPSFRREYVRWVVAAKTGVTRARRLATALQWLAQGKARNWKYQKR
jgi:uncharacterized protein YdeI (YjbR/CyaY-like superfamily)